MTDLLTVTADIPRDRWNRPLVTPPDGGAPVPYTRCTTFVDATDDKQALTKWMQRMVAVGLIDRPDLQLAVAAHRDDRQKLGRICEEAMEAAKAHAAATTGTALHAITEQLDRGHTPTIPADYQPDIDAYLEATRELRMPPEWIETFMVYDPLRIGGTPDRIVNFEGERFIADLKTGNTDPRTGNLAYVGKIAQQLAVYSRSVLYDHTTNTRTRVEGINQNKAIVIHLPAGTGKCTLHWVDIDAGWDAVQLSAAVRTWRARRDLHTPLDAHGEAKAHRLAELINAAGTPEELTDLYRQHRSVWTDEHTAHAAARKADLLTNQ